jgi:hypothetical protein
MAALIGNATAQAKPEHKDKEAPVTIQHDIFTLKGLPLRLAERHVRLLFAPLQCQPGEESGHDYDCIFTSDKKSEFTLAKQNVTHYRFFFTGGELTGIVASLPNNAYDAVRSLIVEAYGAAQESQKGEVETINTGEKSETTTMIWKHGAQRLVLESHSFNLNTMSISLFAVTPNTPELK